MLAWCTKYCENASAVTFLLAPVVGAVALATSTWRPTKASALAAVAVWTVWQRFVSGGWRIPGRIRLAELDGKGAGKTFVVTGANTGIGFWTAVGLVESGAKTVIITCRDPVKCDVAIAAIKKAARHGSNDVELKAVPMELGSIQSVREAAATIAAMCPKGIHCLINNAGAAVMPAAPDQDATTEDGFEATFGINFIAPYVFTDALLPVLRTTSKSTARIVIVASRGHERITADMSKALLRAHPSFHTVGGVDQFTFYKTGAASARIHGYRSYCLSKLGNVIHARALAAQVEGVEAVSLHPGRVLTDVWRPVPILVDPGFLGRLVRGILSLHLRTAVEGANTTLHCALAPAVVNGGYYADSRLVPPAGAAFDAELASLFLGLAHRAATHRTC